MRFSAVWNRVLEAWFAKDIVDSPELTAKSWKHWKPVIARSARAHAVSTSELNPVFAKWLARHSVAG